MADGITLSLSGEISEILSDLDPESYRSAMVDAIQRAVEYLYQEVLQGIPSDSGRARGKVQKQITSRGAGGRFASLTEGDLEGRVFSNDVEVMTLEEGRQAGAAYPPIDALAPWVASHLGDDRLTYVVARAISSRGLPAHHMFARAAEEGADTVESLFVDIVFHS